MGIRIKIFAKFQNSRIYPHIYTNKFKNNVKSARFVSKYRMYTILVNKLKLIDKKVLENVVVR